MTVALPLRNPLVLIVSVVIVLLAVLLLANREPTMKPLTPQQKNGAKLFSSPALGTTGKTCADCHPFGDNLTGVAAGYPRYVEAVGAEITFEDMINRCIVLSLGGEALSPGEKLDALVAYITRNDVSDE
jgi:hypothetical protein